MRQLLLICIGVIVVVGLVVVATTFYQANQVQLSLSADLQYRTHLLADSLKESVEPYYINHSADALQKLVNRYADRERLLGLAVFDSKGESVATTPELASELMQKGIILNSMDADKNQGAFVQSDGKTAFIFVEPLHEGTSVVGAFLVAQDASYIESSVRSVWTGNAFRLVAQLLVFLVALYFIVRWIIFHPVRRLVESVKVARIGGEPAAIHAGAFFRPLATEISKMTHSLTQARRAASEEARMRLEKLDSPWTAERLKEFVKAYVKDRPIYVVSNREPYTHDDPKDSSVYSVPASGMVTALEPVMDATGGTWIAHGSGAGDKEASDEAGKVRVPPDDPKYTLKRITLSHKEVQGHYVGFSNEALWPLCHVAHTRPIFRKEDWQAYKRVNGKFAQAVLAEIKNVTRPLILIQDFHFALLPEMIKAARPDAQVALFWHVPWPSADVFSICPYRKELLEGMLGADILGFHTQQYCNNFMDTVGKEVEALIDFEQFSIAREGHRTYIKAFPISIAFTDSKDEKHVSDRSALDRLGIKTEFLGLGVDRLDYTKGILERFKGIECFLDAYPEYRSRFTFLQIAPPSREGVEKYREYNAQVSAEAERINRKFAEGQWKPIVLEKRVYTHAELQHLYRAANLCLVTSLHDGMNLVAKEFAAARTDEAGVLILSQFAGASRDLKGALILNPYSAEETAEMLLQALTMPTSEQYRRMHAMRNVVKDYNVYRWSAELIKSVANLE